MSRIWMNGLAVLAAGLLFAAGCTKEQTPAQTTGKGAATATAMDTQPSAASKTSIESKTNIDLINYSYGVEIARGLKRQGVEYDPDSIALGMKDVLAGEKLLMSDEEIHTHAAALQNRQARNKLMAAQNNKKAGEAFMTVNKAKDGVVTLPSGLQYKIIKAGNGPKPMDTDIVACRYRGTLIDGKEFGTSADPNNEGQPAEFRVSEVIPGWREAMKLMPVGSKWQLFIPPNLAYGQRGTGRNIGPYATLIFEVELVGIK